MLSRARWNCSLVLVDHAFFTTRDQFNGAHTVVIRPTVNIDIVLPATSRTIIHVVLIKNKLDWRVALMVFVSMDTTVNCRSVELGHNTSLMRKIFTVLYFNIDFKGQIHWHASF